MKIKLNCSLAGIKYAYKPGDVIDVTDKEGKAHIAAGNGVEFREAGPVVTETKDREPLASETRGGKGK